MKTAIKTTLAVVASAAAIAGVATIPSIVSAWGDSAGGRASYSLQYINEHAEDFGKTPFFNSIRLEDSDYAWHKTYFNEDIPEGTIREEKNFVGAREDDGATGAKNVWEPDDVTNVQDGQVYRIRLYAHNNNPYGEEAVAENTRVRFVIPATSSRTVKVNGYITADNASPDGYIDYVNFHSDNAFHLEYVKGSATITSNGAVNGSKLDDSIVNTENGVLIGYNSLDGRIPGCYTYASYIGIDVKVVYDNEFTVEEKVRIAGDTDKTWKDTVTANIGDTVEFQLQYVNTGKDGHRDVAVRDVLSKNLQYIEGSTKLYNTDYPNGGKVNQDTIITNGINIGNYAVGANAFVRFSAKVVGDNLACGANVLTNWGQVQAGDAKIILQDNATVNVLKVCANNKQDEEPTPTPVDELPSTGPEAIAGGIIAAGSIATAAGYYIASRRQLR